MSIEQKVFDEVFSPMNIEKKIVKQKIPKKMICTHIKRGGQLCGKKCMINPEGKCHKHKAKSIEEDKVYIQNWKDRTQTFEKYYMYLDPVGDEHIVKYPAYLRALKNHYNIALGEVDR